MRKRWLVLAVLAVTGGMAAHAQDPKPPERRAPPPAERPKVEPRKDPRPAPPPKATPAKSPPKPVGDPVLKRRKPPR